MTEQSNLDAALDRVVALESALTPPLVWSEAERDGMAAAFERASEKHGHYESLFAVAAFILRHRLAAAEISAPSPEVK